MKNAQFDFSHVQPTAMFQCVINSQLVDAGIFLAATKIQGLVL
jgi:hypothetical protein